MRRNIAFVANNLDIGGPQKGLVALVDELDRTKFNVAIFSLQPNGSLEGYLRESTVVSNVSTLAFAAQMNRGSEIRDLLKLLRHRRVRAASLYLRGVIAKAMGRPVNPWRQRVWHAAKVPLHSTDTVYDAVFAVSSGLSTYFAVDCLRAKRKYHWVIGDYSRTTFDRSLDELYFSKTDGALSVSSECSQIFNDLFPTLNSRLQVFQQLIPWKFYGRAAVNANPYKYPRHLKLLTVTRLDKDKGVDLAVAACQLLIDRGVSVEWIVLGDGEQHSSLQRDILARNLQDSMRLEGFRTNVTDYLAEADVFVLPSRSEGRSAAVDEAIACGVRVVVTNYRTASSQVPGRDVGLVCEMDPAALADAIQEVVRLTQASPDRDRGGRGHDIDPNPLFLELAGT